MDRKASNNYRSPIIYEHLAVISDGLTAQVVKISCSNLRPRWSASKGLKSIYAVVKFARTVCHLRYRSVRSRFWRSCSPRPGMSSLAMTDRRGVAYWHIRQLQPQCEY